MKIQKIYLDTSVIGGCFDDEFSVWSNGLFDDLKRGLFLPVVSEIVATEVSSVSFAPEMVRTKFQELVSFGPEILVADSNVETLVDAY